MTNPDPVAFVPDKFSRRTMAAIEKGLLSRKNRIEIIDGISHRLYTVTETPSSAEYTAVCRELVQKFPTTKDPIGNGYVSFMEIDVYSLCFIIILIWTVLLILSWIMYLAQYAYYLMYREVGNSNYEINLKTWDERKGKVLKRWIKK